jgi:hemoglobin/transferrin/lactoferrin receptor protein
MILVPLAALALQGAAAVSPQSSQESAPQEPVPAAPAAEDRARAGSSGSTVVTAPRAARTSTAPGISNQVVTGEELERTGERSLPRALARTTGLFVQETNLGGGAPILRGMIGNQILIVVDGVRLNDGTTRSGPNQSLNGIDPSTVERVEVIRGPSSVLYGSDALGGVILIWTKNRAAARRSGRSGLGGELDGSFDGATEGWRGSAAASWAWEDDGVLALGSLQDWGDLESGSGEVDHTGYHGQSWFGSWDHAFGDERTLRFSASRTRDFDVPRTDRLNTGFGQTQPADVEHHFRVQDRERFQMTWTDESGGLSDVMQARLSLRRYEERRQLRGNGSTTRRLEKDDTETVGLGADWRKALGDGHLLTWGFDADFDDVDSIRDNVNINTGVVTPATGTFAPESEYFSSGIFVQDEIFAFDAVDVTAGLRYSYFEFGFEDPATAEDEDGDFDALTGSLQVARNVAEGVRLSATVAQGFRAPNLAELARNASFAAGTELSNPDLDPERSLYEELALDVVRERWNASFGVYHNDISDVVGRRLVSDPDPFQTGDEIYLRENTGDLRFFGAEGRYRRDLGDSPFAFETYVEWTWGRQYDDFVDPGTGEQPFDDEPSSKVPPLHGNVSLIFEPDAPWRAISWADLTVWWAERQDDLSPGDLADPRIDPDGTDGWVRVDVDFGGPLGGRGSGATWNLGLHNLLDEEYRVHGSGFDAPGFGVVFGVHASI